MSIKKGDLVKYNGGTVVEVLWTDSQWADVYGHEDSGAELWRTQVPVAWLEPVEEVADESAQ